jgi:3-oxoadipate enol-lactonase
MAYFQHKNVNFHYQEMGSGEAIIALHGLSQHSAYWMDTGVAQALAKTHRVIALDLRAHGLTTIEGSDKGYDITTMQEDIGAFADHLGLDKFHLLGHSTGGMISVRYAMQHSERLLSLLLTNCGSSTNFSNKDPVTNAAALEFLAAGFESFSWEQIVGALKIKSGPLFAGVAAAANKDELYTKALKLMTGGDGKSIAMFVRSFYDDPNPYIEGLESIQCPTLIVSAELDWFFAETSKLMAKHIPNSQHIEGKAMGHMTALEAPQWLSQTLIDFLKQQRNI